ncbi:MAG: type II toxin-antitoxin system VapB family antitoxin [Gaiellaceae bacterium]
MPKTTIDIPDSLLAEAKELAAREGTTLRALVESGLRAVIDRRRRGGQFRLRDASVSGRGLQPEFRDAGWESFRDAAYEDRGA